MTRSVEAKRSESGNSPIKQRMGSPSEDQVWRNLNRRDQIVNMEKIRENQQEYKNILIQNLIEK